MSSSPPAPEEPQKSHENGNSVPKPYMEKFKSRAIYTQATDPCEDAAKASMDCMNRNDYDRYACIDYFKAYRECKKAWMVQRRADRVAGKDTSLV